MHTEGQTITVNNDDPSKPENWFAAALELQPRLQPEPRSDGKPWGLGWYNNPANPFYPAGRGFPFMTDPRDAAKPQNWPYEEKVMGWAAWSIDTGYSYSTDGRQDWPGDSGFSTVGFRPAWWVSEGQRDLVKPPLDAFCNATNNCDSANPPDCPDEDCYKQYWWRGANVTWKRNCANDCGNENIKYVTLRAEPGRGYRLRSGAPQCKRDGLPSAALVVESVPDNTDTYGDCGSSGTDAGNFQFTFQPNPAATGPGLGPYEAKGDLHQIGGGYSGHFWYAHTRDTAHLGGDRGRMTVNGAWTLDPDVEWARVFAHQPDTGAHTQQAHYVIKGVAGDDRHRYVNTHFGTNTWVELGVYRFTGTPKVELTNTTADGTADEDVAWDAVAFQPLSGKPKDMVVAMGDSYTSGEGAGAYSPESDRDHGESGWNACRRSPNAWPRKVILPGQTKSVGSLADSFDPALDFQFTACSGAKTFHMTTGDPNEWGRDGYFHEKTQIDGALSEDTTSVMLTIGGNDARFDNKIQKCVMEGCPSETSMKADIDDAVTETRMVLEQIHDRAPNATISLMGYPLLFSRTEACSTLVSASQRVILNDMAQYFEDEQRELALSMGAYNVKYRSPQSAFEGKRIVIRRKDSMELWQGRTATATSTMATRSPGSAGGLREAPASAARAITRTRPGPALTRRRS